MARILYISYDGLMEPLGQSQIWQYLRQLTKEHKITLVTYEKKRDWSNVSAREILKSEVRCAGIEWVPLRYHKRPTVPATAYDLLVGFLVSSYLVWIRRIQIVHARSYVPSILALALKKSFGVRFLFDMRGLWADERLDAGLWHGGSLIYHLAKYFEKKFLRHADHTVVLTYAGLEAIKQFDFLNGRKPRLEVIRTCVNLELFKPLTSPGKNREEFFTLGYVGNAASWYMFDPVLECFKILREFENNARLLIVNRDQHSYIKTRQTQFHIPEEAVELKAVSYAKIPDEMKRMNAGIFFIKPTFSKKASMPTRLGEYLASGIPCLCNAGIGDIDRILEKENAGVILRDFTAEAKIDAVRKLMKLAKDPEISNRCVFVAQEYFALGEGVASYDRIYHSIEREIVKSRS